MSGRSYHVCGVAGVGMNPLAQALALSGAKVSGSDRYLDQGDELDVFRKLRGVGISLVAQDGSGVTEETSALVVSTAIEEDNPDWLAAKRLGIPVVHRARLLAELAGARRCVAVAGTSGKTTLTGMIGSVLAKIGWDPMVVNGGAVLEWMDEERIGNVRWGASPWCVVEVDESDRSLLKFYPELAVINNISRDHFSFEESVELFQQFARQCGRVVALPEAARAMGLDPAFPDVAMHLEQGRWSVRYEDVTFTLQVPGRHNAENAIAAMATLDAMGCDVEACAEAMGRFRGIHRRLEEVGEAGGVRVVDDYAHNPAKIRASWQAAAERGGRVLGFWRPHGYGPLAAMRTDLGEMFRQTLGPDDRLWILPVYYAGGTATRSVESSDLVGDLQSTHGSVGFTGDYGALQDEILAEARVGDTILGMGARDPDLPRFARICLKALASRDVPGR